MRVSVAAPARPARVSALANREYRGIALAQITSECGDQIAAIALSYLVYGRSNNAFFAAATYAVTYVPLILGGVLLAPLVDRFPRRSVMLLCDVCRAVAVGGLALLTLINGMPIGVLIAVVLLSSFFSPPFTSARSATIPDIFDAGPGYVRAVAIGRILQQVDQVFGFALGGIIVAAVSPRGALTIDAFTFIASFLVIASHVRYRPPALLDPQPGPRRMLANVVPDLRLVLSSPARRALMLLAASTLLFLIAPEALAVAYARQHGHGAVAAGVLTAAQPFGVALGAWLFIKFVPPRQQGRLLLPLASGGALCLAATALVPPLWLTCALWLVSGLLQCFMIATIATYNIATERELRGRANGLAAAAISVTQGLGFLLWGAVGTWRGAAAGVAWAGVAGLLILSLVRYVWPDEHIAAAWARLEAAQAAD